MKKEQYIQIDLNDETLSAFILDPLPGIGDMIRVFLLKECKEISILPEQIIEATPEGDEKTHLEACWDESFGYRGNTRKMEDGSLSSIYQKDLNGDSLELLTRELASQLEITLQIEKGEA
jgi:hypothetical protein